MEEIKIKSTPFSWHRNFSEEAIEAFDNIRDKIPYCECQCIGMALAKLELIEKNEIEGE